MKVPILMYHSVREDDAPAGYPVNYNPAGYRISPAFFERQLEYLRGQGYTSVSLSELREWSRKKRSLPDRAIVLTFDDGYIDNHRVVLPLLSRYGFQAAFFLCADSLGEKGMMGPTEAGELLAAGMEVGSHGIGHRMLVGRPPGLIFEELVRSRDILSVKLAARIDFFSIPRGFQPRGMAELGRRAGYLGICTSIPGMNSAATDPYRWKRFPVRTGLGEMDFQALVSGRGYRYFFRLIREQIRSLARLRFYCRKSSQD